MDAKEHTKRRKRLMSLDACTDLRGPTPYVSLAAIVMLIACEWYVWFCIYKNGADGSCVANIVRLGFLAWLNANTLCYSLGTFIHENSHGLVLGARGRLLTAHLIELGLVSFGEQWEYTYVHSTQHHPHLNDAARDSECPSPLGHVAGRGGWCDALIEILPGGILLTAGNLSNNTSDARVPLGPRVSLSLLSAFVHAFLLIHGAWMVNIFIIWSVSLFSSRWCISLHGQSIAEHRTIMRSSSLVSTWSTYHRLENLVSFNTGYHDEHHTFTDVSWINLPKIKERFTHEFKNEQKERYAFLWWTWAWSGFDSRLFRICKDK